jgi:hypothetical protein
MFLVEQQIASAREELFKRDMCQGRPMVRIPSVPLDYLYKCSRYNGTKVLRPRPLLLNVCPLLISD